MLVDKNQTKENAILTSAEVLEKDDIKVKKKFGAELLDFAVDEKESIEFIINKYAEAKNSEQMNPLILSILTIAIAELLKDKETDRPIIFSEYLYITSEFFGRSETGFVNAVLDKFVKGLHIN